MKADRIFWGLILIALGVLFFLENLNIIDFSFRAIWKLWPLALIYWGFSALLKGANGKASPALYVIQVAILAVVLYYVVKPNGNSSSLKLEDSTDLYWDETENEELGSKGKTREHQFNLDWDDAIQEAHLELNFGAGKLTLASADDELFSAQANTSLGSYGMEHSSKDGKAQIALRHSSKKSIKLDNSFKNDLKVQLHSSPVWRLDLETGASDCQLDLKGLTLAQVNVEGGASKLDIALGDARQKGKIKVEAGVSDIQISLPTTAAASIEVEEGLSAFSIDGFERLKKGYYQSKNFDLTKPHYEIQIEAGVSNISITTY